MKKKSDLFEKAKELATKDYAIRIVVDKTTDGESIYMASNPELEGCMAQGETVEEAQSILEEVRIDYLAHLLEYGLPIPGPREKETTTKVEKNSSVYIPNEPIIGIGISAEEFDEILELTIQPTEREILLEA